MQYYLDTNILAFILSNQDNISEDVAKYLDDYANAFYTSSICVKELIYLLKSNKISSKFIKKNISAVFDYLQQAGIKIIPPTEKHLKIMAELPFDPNSNKDSNDYLIVAQAISDKMALISSDKDFKRFGDYGLNFVFNKR